MSVTPRFDSLADAARALRSKSVSPVELTELCLQRIEAHDRRINAFITVISDRALDDARVAESEILAGRWRGPLHGIPIGLKDVIETKGIATTANSYQLSNYRPVQDAALVGRLTKAGAIVMGKLATHEFSLGGPSWDLPWPPARNPWNTEHFTGGSSSGPAAAVAAGFVLGAIGSDTSGSVRSPAALCGIAGLKPTYDAIDPRGVIPLAPSLDTVGTMAWTANDCGVLFNAICRRDRMAGLHSQRFGGLQADLNIKGTRIKVIRHFFETDSPISDANKVAINEALTVFRELGCEIEEGHLPPLDDWMACGFVLLLAEAYSAHEHWLKHRPDGYGAAFRNAVMLGATLSASDYLNALRRRDELKSSMEALMQDCDLLVSCVQSGEAPRLDRVSPWGAFERPSYAMPFSVTGQPALSLCCGFGAGGLPLGIQLVGRWFAEHTLLRAGCAYEHATAWRKRRPVLEADIRPQGTAEGLGS